MRSAACVESAVLSEAVTGISGCRSSIAFGSLRTRRLGFRCLQTQRTCWSGGDTECTPRTLRGIRSKPRETYLPSRRDGCRRKVRSSQCRSLPGWTRVWSNCVHPKPWRFGQDVECPRSGARAQFGAGGTAGESLYTSLMESRSTDY